MFGLSLSLMNEALVFAGALLGMQFSFSLVNLLDPNSKVETPVLGQMLGWLGVLVVIGSGLDRSSDCWSGAQFLCGSCGTRGDRGEDWLSAGVHG